METLCEMVYQLYGVKLTIDKEILKVKTSEDLTKKSTTKLPCFYEVGPPGLEPGTT